MTTFTVNDQTFDVQDIYEAGHTLNEFEAAALNEVRASKIASAWGQRIRQAAKKGREFDGSQAALEQYAAAYQLGNMPRGPVGKGAKDPVAAEAKRVATEMLRAHIKAQGAKPSAVANFDQLVEELAAREDIVARARERVEAAKSIAIGELSLEMKPAPAEPEPPAAEEPQPTPSVYGPVEQAAEQPRKNRRRVATPSPVSLR
jgi:hypothetical protein